MLHSSFTHLLHLPHLIVCIVSTVTFPLFRCGIFLFLFHLFSSSIVSHLLRSSFLSSFIPILFTSLSVPFHLCRSHFFPFVHPSYLSFIFLFFSQSFVLTSHSLFRYHKPHIVVLISCSELLSLSGSLPLSFLSFHPFSAFLLFLSLLHLRPFSIAYLFHISLFKPLFNFSINISLFQTFLYLFL